MTSLEVVPTLDARRARARGAIREAMASADIADFDAMLGAGGTALIMSGKRWPTPLEIQLIEATLDWPYGTIQSIVHRPDYASLSGTEQALVDMIHSMSEDERCALIELLKVTKVRAEQLA